MAADRDVACIFRGALEGPDCLMFNLVSYSGEVGVFIVSLYQFGNFLFHANLSCPAPIRNGDQGPIFVLVPQPNLSQR